MGASAYEALFALFAFALGAVIGSFLNVVIYRMPLGLSLNEPKRSFCPHCERQIPWVLNIPLVSWVWLRGRCAFCKQRIPVRYLLVELVTAALFLALWWHAWPRVELAFAWWILGGLLIAATFIDLEHYIIPDEITLGSVAAGLVCAMLVPRLVGAHGAWEGALGSVLGAVVGFALLFGVVELGKLAFGRRAIRCESPTEFRVRQGPEGLDFVLGDETSAWEEIFTRPSDRLLIACDGETRVGERSLSEARVEFRHDRLIAGGAEIPLREAGEICGRAVSLVVPREAMGFGDVKFIAGIGAFLGWKAVVFAVGSASVIGSFVGIATIAVGRREWGARLPFGPYLAAGALLWIFVGQAFLDWYLAFLWGPDPIAPVY